MSITKKELVEKLTPKDFAQKIIEWYERPGSKPEELAELLGVTLAPEKPEPGPYASPSGGQVFVAGPKDAWIRLADGLWQHHWPDGLNLNIWKPARMVPAEPPVLTEAEVGELWDEVNVSRKDWFGYTGVFHEQVTATVNAALAKRGHGRVEVPRADVESALLSGMEKTMVILAPITLKHATDAVMALLGGGDNE